jgi:hypothetical protein
MPRNAKRPAALLAPVLMMAPFMLASALMLAASGCSSDEFQATPQGGAAIHVGAGQDSAFTSGPLAFRMRSDEGHVILWIVNPTDAPVELIGDKSEVVDAEGIAHPLHRATIAPHDSIREVFPPVVEPPNTPPPGSESGVNPYDRPGFISLPDASASGGGDSAWQWVADMNVQINLYFQQNGHAFETHLAVHRELK